MEKYKVLNPSYADNGRCIIKAVPGFCDSLREWKDDYRLAVVYRSTQTWLYFTPKLDLGPTDWYPRVELGVNG